MIKWSTLVAKVRFVINEVDTTDDTFSEETDSSIQEFIRQALPLLAVNPLYRGPVSTLQDSASSVSFHERPDGAFYALIDLPSDFLRLVSLKLSEWVRPVFELLPASHPSFAAQHYAVPGIGAGPRSPVAYITDSAYSRAIMAHSVSSAQSQECELRYVASPATTDESIDVSPFYAYPLVYLAAGLFLQAASESAAAKAAFATAQAYMEQTYKNQITE
jgi:hypothetical protein